MSKSVVSEVKGRFISASEVMNRFGKVGKKLSVSKSRDFFESVVSEVCANGSKEYQIH